MALTLAEAAKLSNDLLVKGVFETVVKASPLLERMPFIEVSGNALTYNREAGPGTAAFYAVGAAWAEDTPTFTQVTTSLKILGGDADVDNYLRQTRSNIQDIEAVVLELKVKAVAHKFEETAITGDSTVDPNAFDGLRTIIGTGSQAVTMGTNGATLTLAKLDEMLDLIRPGKPDLIIMSRRSRRKLNELRRAASSQIEGVVNEFGRWVELYNGIPIAVSDFVPDNETVGTSTDCSSIYAVAFGEDGLVGLTNGWIQVERVGSLEARDATRNRVKWYCGLALFSTLKVARLYGVRP